jgi:hypothetical protein
MSFYCNSIVVIIGIDGTCHGQNIENHETMLNGKFASYKLKANSYINLGNINLKKPLIFILSSFNNQTRSSSRPISWATNLSSSKGQKPQLHH